MPQHRAALDQRGDRTLLPTYKIRRNIWENVAGLLLHILFSKDPILCANSRMLSLVL